MSKDNEGLAYSYPSPAGTTTGTITDDSVDTIVLPIKLLSSVSYCWSLTGTTNTGTAALSLSLQESNQTTGDTDCVQVGTATVDANETVRITGEVAYGIRQRLVITGSGTQDTDYVLTARFKY